jgi:hypothetical protein
VVIFDWWRVINHFFTFKFHFIGLNPYLTLNTSGSGTVLIDLSPDDKEFQSVEEEVCSYP